MMKKNYIIILGLILSLNFTSQKLYAQESEFSKFNNFFEPEIHHHNWSDQLRNNHNEAKFVFSMLFVIYKEFFSSQDVDSCVFIPSCSVYAVESIKKNGIIYGLFDAFDRLTRCNPGPKSFPIDPNTKKYYDPVQ